MIGGVCVCSFACRLRFEIALLLVINPRDLFPPESQIQTTRRQNGKFGVAKVKANGWHSRFGIAAPGGRCKVHTACAGWVFFRYSNLASFYDMV